LAFLLAWAVFPSGSGSLAPGDRAPRAVAGSQAGETAGLRIGDGTGSIYTVTPGGQATTPIEVVAAVNLAAATALLTFDPAVVQPVACAGPATPVFDGGYCNIDYALGVVKFNVVALAGVTGTRRLYDITFQAVGGGSGATTTPLTLSVTHFADPYGVELPVQTTGGRIDLVGPSTPADVTVEIEGGLQGHFDLVPGTSLPVPLTLNISEPHKLGAGTVLLRYDPQVLRPTQCGLSAGVMGYCNPGFDPAQGLVKLNLVTGAGLTGSLAAAEIIFEAASGALPGATSGLVLIVEHVADVAGAPLTWTAVNGSVSIVSGASNSALVRVGDPTTSGVYTVTQGITVPVAIWVTDVVGLGAATLALGYDPAVVRPLGCTVRDDVTLAIDGGACALYSDRVQMSLIAAEGISGAAHLYDVIFTAAVGALFGASSPLSVTVHNFADTAGQPLPSQVRGSSLAIVPGSTGPPVALVRWATRMPAPSHSRRTVRWSWGSTWRGRQI